MAYRLMGRARRGGVRRFAPQPLPWPRHNERARSALGLRRGTPPAEDGKS